MLLRRIFLAPVLLSQCGALYLPTTTEAESLRIQESKDETHPTLDGTKHAPNQPIPNFYFPPSSHPQRSLTYADRQTALRHLIQTCLLTFDRLAVNTWLTQDTLLEPPLVPNPTLHISDRGLMFLSAYYNTTVFNVTTDDRPAGHSYLLLLSPHARKPLKREGNPVPGETGGSTKATEKVEAKDL
ncbi:mannosyltransferase [Collariella sp. IMI 366227]|nr:mannosyltransferase [Collariella sp. IMI 366227]